MNNQQELIDEYLYYCLNKESWTRKQFVHIELI